jgi:hypothetical protein
MSGENEREWRDVCGWGGIYVGLYQVSNDGLVKSTVRVKTGRILKPGLNRGYLNVGLSVDGKLVTRKVHQLVAQAFIPNPDNKGEIDHIDRDKQNNHVTNLRWATRSENCTNTAGRSNTGLKHISRTLSNGYPAFHVQITRGHKLVVSKRFYIGDRDEADVMAEAVAYRNDKYAELGIQIDDREADGGTDRDAGARTDGCAHLQPILEYIRDNVIRRAGTGTDA